MSALRGVKAKQGPRVAYGDTAGCEQCVNCRPSMLFTLCQARQSEYRVDGVVQFHTIQHMRDENVGLCGPEKAFFEKRKES